VKSRSENQGWRLKVGVMIDYPEKKAPRAIGAFDRMGCGIRPIPRVKGWSGV
jgi:hypothetical protein